MFLGAFVAGWVTDIVLLGRSPGSTGTGFGNLAEFLLAAFVGAVVGVVGLVLFPFGPTRPLGSLVAALGGGYFLGVMLFFLMQVL